jgi:hypothetical protein
LHTLFLASWYLLSYPCQLQTPSPTIVHAIPNHLWGPRLNFGWVDYHGKTPLSRIVLFCYTPALTAVGRYIARGNPGHYFHPFIWPFVCTLSCHQLIVVI